MSKLLILSDEFLARINVGLGEIAAKFAIPVIMDIEAQVSRTERDAEAFLAAIEAHVAPIRAKLAQTKAEAEKLAATPAVEVMPPEPAKLVDPPAEMPA